MTTLKIYKTHPEVSLPSFATKQSACFDIAMQFHGKKVYEGFNNQKKPFEREHKKGSIYFSPGDKIKVPTGLIFDIPEGFSVRLHARSSTAYKNGLVLVNSEGIIDSDYTEEVFLLMWNTSDNGVQVETGERLCQAELIKQEIYTIEETKDRPGNKTDRKGGIGSTGTKTKKTNET